MTLVVPENHALIIHSMAFAGDTEAMAVTYGVFAPAVTAGDVQTIADDCAQAFVDNILPVLVNDITLQQTEAYVQVDPLPASPLIGVSVISGTGAGIGQPLPPNSAYLCHKRTATGGRVGRGRFYLPGVASTAVDAVGNVLSGTVTSINAGLAAFHTDIAASTPIDYMVLFHDDGGAGAALPPYPLTSLTVDPKIATQRRRLRP